jgi:D-alanyl-D-alanine carboxypeptidase (penicillin-binding protein 5/6)
VTEMASPNGSWRPTAALLDWAFAHGAALTPVGRLVEPVSSTAARSAPTLAAGWVHPVAGGRVGSPSLTPLLGGVAALIGAVALVGAWSARARSISRRRRSSRTRR